MNDHSWLVCCFWGKLNSVNDSHYEKLSTQQKADPLGSKDKHYVWIKSCLLSFTIKASFFFCCGYARLQRVGIPCMECMNVKNLLSILRGLRGFRSLSWDISSSFIGGVLQLTERFGFQNSPLYKPTVRQRAPVKSENICGEICFGKYFFPVSSCR